MEISEHPITGRIEMDSEVFGGNTWIFDGEVVAADDPTGFNGGSGFEFVGFAVAWTSEDFKCESERSLVLLFFHFTDTQSEKRKKNFKIGFCLAY